MSAEHFFEQLAIKLQTATPGTTGSEYMKLAVKAMVPIMQAELAMMTADIREFHEKFGLAYDGPPRALDREMHGFRQAFMQEELDEYEEGHEADDLEKQLDALVDLAYTVLGTAYLQGFPFAKAWSRVHKANMAKVRVESASDSKRGSSLDVVKPEGWQAPCHKDLVEVPEVDWDHA